MASSDTETQWRLGSARLDVRPDAADERTPLNITSVSRAPEQYDATYMSEVVRSFSVFLELFNNPGDARHTELTLTNLQQNDYNHKTGAVFQQDGVENSDRQ